MNDELKRIEKEKKKLQSRIDRCRACLCREYNTVKNNKDNFNFEWFDGLVSVIDSILLGGS